MISTPEGTYGIVWWRDIASFSKYVPQPQWDNLPLVWSIGKITEGEKVIVVLSSQYEEDDVGECYAALIPKACVEKIIFLSPT